MRGLSLTAFVIAGLLGPHVYAQSPQDTQPKSGLVAPSGTPGQPLYAQADQLLYDTRQSRVVMQGSVELYFNNHIVSADEVVYDQGSSKLTAEGNVQLKAADGTVTRADRMQLTDEFRDAFAASLTYKGPEPRLQFDAPAARKAD